MYSVVNRFSVLHAWLLTSSGRSLAASLSRTPLTYLCPSVPPKPLASSMASLMITRYGVCGQLTSSYAPASRTLDSIGDNSENGRSRYGLELFLQPELLGQHAAQQTHEKFAISLVESLAVCQMRFDGRLVMASDTPLVESPCRANSRARRRGDLAGFFTAGFG